jgi:hypothetical protein
MVECIGLVFSMGSRNGGVNLAHSRGRIGSRDQRKGKTLRTSQTSLRVGLADVPTRLGAAGESTPEWSDTHHSLGLERVGREDPAGPPARDLRRRAWLHKLGARIIVERWIVDVADPDDAPL